MCALTILHELAVPRSSTDVHDGALECSDAAGSTAFRLRGVSTVQGSTVQGFSAAIGRGRRSTMRGIDGDRAPIMADVARIAGVSHQTVSRVLNDHPNVRPATRDRVLAAIRELGYRPNAAARTLVTRRTRTLGVISFNTTLYGPASMLYGIEQAAKQYDYFVTVAALAALDRRSVLDAVDRLRDQAVEGIIVIAPQTTAVGALANVRSDVALVAVGGGTHASLASVAGDNEAGAERATSYLPDLGHTSVHH